jgi:hypothetical protein
VPPERAKCLLQGWHAGKYTGTQLYATQIFTFRHSAQAVKKPTAECCLHDPSTGFAPFNNGSKAPQDAEARPQSTAYHKCRQRLKMTTENSTDDSGKMWPVYAEVTACVTRQPECNISLAQGLLRHRISLLKNAIVPLYNEGGSQGLRPGAFYRLPLVDTLKSDSEDLIKECAPTLVSAKLTSTPPVTASSKPAPTRVSTTPAPAPPTPVPPTPPPTPWTIADSLLNWGGSH